MWKSLFKKNIFSKKKKLLTKIEKKFAFDMNLIENEFVLQNLQMYMWYILSYKFMIGVSNEHYLNRYFMNFDKKQKK